MYPMAFGTNLQRIASTWPTLVSGMQAAGMKMGMGIRLDSILDSPTTSHLVDPTNSADLNAMVAQIAICKNMGVKLYYVDSFGAGYNDTLLYATYKTAMGADAQVYTESCNDISFAYFDHYCELQDQAGDLTQMGNLMRSILQYLYPQSVWLSAPMGSSVSSYPAATLDQCGLTLLGQDYDSYPTAPTNFF